jgi:hypothetical protein
MWSTAGLTGTSPFGVLVMKKVWMKPYACGLTLAAMFDLAREKRIP